MSKPQTARCRTTAFDELECSFPFREHPKASRALIDAWKAHIPYSRRSYVPETRVWRFWGGYEEDAATLLISFFPDADVPTHARRRKTRPEPRTTGTDHFRVLHLRETAPVELIESAYRVLARLHHPDAGGFHEAMQQINGAYAALRERVSA